MSGVTPARHALRQDAVSSPAVIGELRGVSAAYFGDIHVLQGLDLTFNAGRVAGIIGPNGAGKSTVLKTFFGLLRPLEGDVLLNGQSVARTPSHAMAAMGVAYLPQGRSLFLDLTVEDNLLLGCWPIRSHRRAVRSAVQRALDIFPSLHDARRQSAGSLSGGQRRFLELARALLLEPKLLLLDEPTAMIAPRFAAEVYAMIRSIANEGVAVVLVDQNIRPCVEVSDHIYVLELGRKTAEGTAQDLQTDDALRDVIAGWLEVRGG